MFFSFFELCHKDETLLMVGIAASARSNKKNEAEKSSLKKIMQVAIEIDFLICRILRRFMAVFFLLSIHLIIFCN